MERGREGENEGWRREREKREGGRVGEREGRKEGTRRNEGK